MILTKSGAGYFNIDGGIKEKINSGRYSELLLIVPTNRKIRALKKEIISQSPGKATGRLNIETIGTYSTKLLSAKTRINPDLLSEAASSVLLKQSFQETTLNYFSHYKKEIPQGTVTRVKNVISDYKKHGITPELLRREAEHLSESEKLKALDIAAVYDNYLEKCRSLNIREIGDVYHELEKSGKEEFSGYFRDVYPECNLIIIMGFDEFTSPEIEIINSTSEIEGSRLFLSFDYFKYNPLIFSHLDKCYNKLMSKGFTIIEEGGAGNQSSFEPDIKKNLFRKMSSAKIDDYESSITKIKSSTREKEIELIAKEIKQLISYNNVEPHTICIAFNLIGKYSASIRDIFKIYGIPFNLTDRYSLSTSPPVISIINFLEVLENDFYYKNIFRALSGGFIRMRGVNLSNLLRASVNLKIISGYENWRFHLMDAIHGFEAEEDLFTPQKPEKEIYEKALMDIDKIYQILSPFNKKMKLGEFRENLQNIIFSLNIPSIMINNTGFEHEENIKAITTFTDMVNEILELFELEYGKDEKFSLKFFLNNIRTAVSSTRYNIKERPGYGVQVTTMNEIRGLKFDYLFLSGLNDGDFPTRFSPEIFFSGSYARSEHNHQVEERYLFYQSLCSWNMHLYLTVPVQEERKELSESNFLAEFENVFSIQNKTEKDYADTIFSKEEFLVELGKSGIDKLNCYNELVEGIIPERLSKGISVNQTRANEPFGESEYTGIFGNILEQEFKDKLGEYRQKQFSISQLETFAKCPHKYFLERVIGLNPVEEPTEDVEAKEMGSILHSILYEFYKSLRLKKINLQTCSADEFKIAEKLIFKIAQSKIEDTPSFGGHSNLAFYEKEKIMGIDNKRKNSLLYKFLLKEREDTSGFIPELFEKGFGNVEDNPRIEGEMESIPNINILAGGIKVKGKIDRIDINPDDKTFKVVDYKLSGKRPTGKELEENLSLQLPLYMYAAKELIKEELNEEYNPAGAEIYSLKFAEKDFGKMNILPGKKSKSAEEAKERNEQVINLCIQAINIYVEEIASGKFNLSTQKNREELVCGYCNFKGICRIQEIN